MARKEKFYKEDLLQMGVQFVKEKGIENLNARELAKFIGCSTQPIFRNYDNMAEYKKELKKYMKDDYNKFIEQYVDKKNYLLTISFAYALYAKIEKSLFRALFITELAGSRTVNEVINSSWNRETIKSMTFQYKIPLEKAEQVYRDVRFYTHGIATQLCCESIVLEDVEIYRLIKNAIAQFIQEVKARGEIESMNLENRNKEMRKFFTNKIDRYDEIHLKLMDNKTKITEKLSHNTNKVLDLGAGTGLELIPLFGKFPNANVVAIDITENMLQKLKTRNFSRNVTTICGDFFEVDFGRNYDAVISSAALHHFNMKDKEILFKKIYDCLKVGGQFINSDKFAKDDMQEILLMREYMANTNPEAHIDTPLTIEHERQVLKKVGFRDIQFEELGDGGYRLMVCRK